jgi:hypothetical protein
MYSRYKWNKTTCNLKFEEENLLFASSLYLSLQCKRLAHAVERKVFEKITSLDGHNGHR